MGVCAAPQGAAGGNGCAYGVTDGASLKMAKRKAISKKTRFEVFKRDGFACQYCGDHPPKVILELDHIVAVAGGGSADSDNLITACYACNRGKAARPLSDVPQSLKDKAVEVAEREAQLKGYHDIMQARRDRVENEAWTVAIALRPNAAQGFPRDWLQSIKTFLGRLDFHDVLESMEVARSRKPHSENQGFRYFCGICWNKIRDR